MPKDWLGLTCGASKYRQSRTLGRVGFGLTTSSVKGTAPTFRNRRLFVDNPFFEVFGNNPAASVEFRACRERAIIIETTMNAPPRSATASRLRPIAMGYLEFWRFQLTLLAIGLAVVGIFWLFQGHVAFPDIVSPLIFTFIVGNCTHFSALAAVPVYAGRSFPWDVVLLLAILIPASIVGGYLASIVTRLVLQQGDGNLLRFSSPDILKCIFLSLVIAIPIYLSRKSRARLEMRNRELEGQVTLGQIELKTQEAELRAASEIQTQLLPREIPRVKGLEVACAWQPARSVGGEYFDVLALASAQIGICLADVLSNNPEMAAPLRPKPKSIFDNAVYRSQLDIMPM